MSEHGRATQSIKRPLSPTDKSCNTQSKRRVEYPELLNSVPQTPVGSYAALSKRVLAGRSNATQLSLDFTSGVESHPQGPSSVDTGEPSYELKDEDYNALLSLAYERLDNFDQKADVFVGDGKYTEGTRNCISCTQARSGASLHNRAPHKEKVINKLPWKHNWSPWETFAKANDCDLVHCSNKRCPSYHIPSLRYKQDPDDQEVERINEDIPTDLEILKAEYGCSDASSEFMKHVLEGFEYSHILGRTRLRSEYGLQDGTVAAATRRRGWSEYKTKRNIDIVKQAQEESQRRGSTERGTAM